jgi:hypothetical protein
MDISAVSLSSPIKLQKQQCSTLQTLQKKILSLKRNDTQLAAAIDSLVQYGSVINNNQSGGEIPHLSLQLRILTYPHLQGKTLSKYYFVLKSSAAAPTSPRWWELSREQAQALKKLTPILKRINRPWPVLTTFECHACFASNAGQLWEEVERLDLTQEQETEKGKMPLGKKLVLDWLNELRTSTVYKEDVEANLKSLFDLFKWMPKGKIQFTEEEYAPFREEARLGFSEIRGLIRNQTIPSPKKLLRAPSTATVSTSTTSATQMGNSTPPVTPSPQSEIQPNRPTSPSIPVAQPALAIERSSPLPLQVQKPSSVQLQSNPKTIEKGYWSRISSALLATGAAWIMYRLRQHWRQAGYSSSLWV